MARKLRRRALGTSGTVAIAPFARRPTWSPQRICASQRAWANAPARGPLRVESGRSHVAANRTLRATAHKRTTAIRTFAYWLARGACESQLPTGCGARASMSMQNLLYFLLVLAGVATAASAISLGFRMIRPPPRDDVATINLFLQNRQETLVKVEKLWFGGPPSYSIQPGITSQTGIPIRFWRGPPTGHCGRIRWRPTVWKTAALFRSCSASTVLGSRSTISRSTQRGMGAGVEPPGVRLGS